MALVKVENLDFTDKKLSILVYGVPSIGKTTLALSAPKPLLIDLDKGISRVQPKYRKDALIVETFEELLNDINTIDLSKYETIVIDTGGRLLELSKPYVIKQEARNATKAGHLSLAGYGGIAREFQAFSEKVKSLNKHVVYIFHANEERDDENVVYRLSAEGQTRTKIWESIDLGGFMEVIGKERTINFSPNARSFAKGNNTINGSYKVPVLDGETIDNNFLERLITKYLEELNVESEELNEQKEIYNRAMKFQDIIADITDLDSANETYEMFTKLNFALTAKRELWTMFIEKTKELGFEFDRNSQAFIAKE